MKIKFLKSIFVATFIFISTFSFVSAEDKVDVYLFGRDDCNYCQLEESFLDKQLTEGNDFNLIRMNVKDSEIKKQFNQLADVYEFSKATPVTLIGDTIIQGFNSEETTGQDILKAIENHKGKEKIT